MKTFLRLARFSAFAVLLLVAVGGLVRATGSGLGCLDEWPTCHGGWIAPLEYTAVIEWSHRALAGIVGIAVIATAAASVKAPIRRWEKVLSWVIVAEVGVQGLLGRWVVKADLAAGIVTLHFITGMAIVASTVVLALTPRRALAVSSEKVRTLSLVGVGLVAVLMILGTLVRQHASGLAFTDWPLVDGGVLPDVWDSHAVWMWTHRLVAALVFGHLTGVWLSSKRAGGELKIAGEIMFAVYAAQVLIGGANVLSGLAAWAVLGHVATGGLAWASIVAVATLASTSKHQDLVLE